MKNKKYNVIIIAVMTIIVLIFALKDDLIEKIQYLFSFNIWWFLSGVLLIFIFWLLKSLVMYFIVNKFDQHYSFKKAFKMIIDTQFVNAITPFSTGGQPYQIYRLKKQGYSIEKGTNVVIQDFIAYQIALILLGTIAIITNHFLGIYPDNHLLKHLVIVGYIINVLVIVILFVVAFNKKGNSLILKLIINIGAKLRIIKEKNKFLNRINDFITDYHKNALILVKSKLHFIKITMINLLALISLYLIPYVLIMGLGEYINPYIAVMTSAYVMLIGAFVPIPGASGGLEFSFINFFGFFVMGAKLSSIMIVWRILTYYLGLIVGAISISFNKED